MGKPEKSKDNPQAQKPKKLDPLFVKPEVELIPFESPNPYGWYTVGFPDVHDQNTILDIWLEEARVYLNEMGITCWSFSFAHGLPVKKNGERISPLFFFREEMDAYRFAWHCKGEVLNTPNVEHMNKQLLVSVNIK